MILYRPDIKNSKPDILSRYLQYYLEQGGDEHQPTDRILTGKHFTLISISGDGISYVIPSATLVEKSHHRWTDALLKRVRKEGKKDDVYIRD